MKKLLLSLGTIAAVAAPIGAVIACAPETDVLSDSEIATRIKEIRGESINKVNKETEGLTSAQKTEISDELRSATTIKELRSIMDNLPETAKNVGKTTSQASAEELQAAYGIIKSLDEKALESSKLSQAEKDTYSERIKDAKTEEALEAIMNELTPKINAAGIK